ncbi:MAG: hypothetical protein AAGA69_04830 [Pseudomonadota bacterium]
MRLQIAAASLSSGMFGVSMAQDCTPTPEKNAVRILGTEPDGTLTKREFPYIAGDRNFYQTLDNGWIFALVKAENGWSLRLYEGEPVGDAVDLTSMTPPLRGAPNPRDIFGWHFRNADNTGPNEGDVNAPQHMRAFVISPSLAGTGGYRPPEGGEPQPSPRDGIGWLKVLDFGLAGLEPGQRARMNYLKFDACLSWPRPQEEQDRLTDLASPAYTDADLETFGSCGLDLQAVDLEAAYLPRTLGGDLDGDNALDEVAQIRRKSDGKRGIALCRAGTWLHTMGLDGKSVGEMDPGYIDQVEAWQWVSPTGDVPRHLQGMTLPEADGDILVLERIEKQAMLVYWKDGALKAEQAYRYVEP